jgi:CBS domain containing-hemolysin-like protein
MTAGDIVTVLVAILLVLAAAVFAAADTALSRVSHASVDELVRGGRRGAARLSRIVADPARYINVALFLRTVCEVLAIVLVARVCLERLPEVWAGVLVATLAMVVVSYVVVGVAPRTLARQHAPRVALVLAGPVSAFATVLGPITRLLIVVGNALTPGPGFRKGPFTSEAELRELVDLAERDRLIEDDERQMIHSVFELGDTLAREVMVPRPDMVVIERDKTLRQAVSLALRSGFSRIPVVGENVDDIVGLVYLKDVTRRIYEYRDAERDEHVDDVMRPASFVPDSKPVDELLREMQAQRIHAAVVVDEYGGTAGLVTIEDILEEIVGEISDEYDTGRPEIEELPDGDVRVSARLNVDDFAERFGLDADAEEFEDVDSVGGLLGSLIGKVPIAGSEVRFHGLLLRAESLAGRRNRIGTVLVHRLSPDGEGESDAGPDGPVPGQASTTSPEETGAGGALAQAAASTDPRSEDTGG